MGNEQAGEKVGKGGNGLQGYDEDGKYIAETGITEKQALDIIQKDPSYKAAYDSFDDNTKKEMVSAVIKAVNEFYTKEKMSEEFQTNSVDEYERMAEDNVKSLEQKYGVAKAQELLDWFFHGYRGAGTKCFNFNKALRIGYEKAYQWYINAGSPGVFPSKDEVEARRNGLDELAQSYEMPKNSRVIRYVDENWIVSKFRPLLNGFQITKDPYGYETIERDVPIKDIANALMKAKGSRLDGDGGFTSFTVAPELTHMGAKADKDRYKRVLLKYDVPKGTKCFISQYRRESEGMFPRNTKFFVKNVSLEQDENQNERAVITIGIR